MSSGGGIGVAKVVEVVYHSGARGGGGAITLPTESCPRYLLPMSDS